jgi:hypothetical protein
VPPKPDAARAGEGGRDDRDYRLKIVFRIEEIVHRRLASRATWTSPPAIATNTRSQRSPGDTSNPIDGARRGLPISRGRKDLEVDRRPHPS